MLSILVLIITLAQPLSNFQPRLLVSNEKPEVIGLKNYNHNTISALYRQIRDGKDDNGLTLPSGIYFVNLKTKNNQYNNKLIYQK
jgi:hypothetical protein